MSRRRRYQVYFTVSGTVEVEATSKKQAEKLAENVIIEGENGYITAEHDFIRFDDTEVVVE